MISWHDLYTVLAAVVPLYVAMILAYGSVRWWKIFSPDQCSGINRFVAIFAVPLLSFHFISTNNPYDMNLKFIAADTLQKLLTLAALALWTNFTGSGSLDWMITIFSLSTLPNTLVMGIPLFIAMYGPYAGSLMVQVVVLQCIIWYTLLLFLFEYRGAKILITDQFPETAASIVSFKVDSDVVSLDGRDFLETDAQLGDDGKLHVTVRKSNASRRSLGPGSLPAFTPRPSNLTGAEIYSLSSSRNPTPRGSNFNHADFYSMMGYTSTFPGRGSNFAGAELYSVQSSRGVTPRPSNFDEGCAPSSPRFGFYPAPAPATYPAPNPEFAAMTGTKTKKNQNQNHQQPPPIDNQQAPLPTQLNNKTTNHDAKELPMFVWSSSATPISEVRRSPRCADYGGNQDQSGQSDQPHNGESSRAIPESEEVFPGEEFAFHGGRGNNASEDEEQREKDGPEGLSKLGSSSTAELHPKDDAGGGSESGPGGGGGAGKQLPPASVMTRLILIMVWRKLIRNPNTYSSLIGVVWSLIAFRWHVNMPKIIAKSISILSDAGLGMAMFSLGLFMALQPKIIACGNTLATFSMALRFLTGPVVMAVASIIIGLRSNLLRIAIVQAALPQGIVPFVFAKEYNNHPAVLSTAVIFGMLIALPIDLVYYILVGI